jgi:competence protein ComEC
METKNRFLKWLQDNLTVGIAAQVATLPIMLGFLGKFPLLFIITNLITLPISIVATYVGFLLLFIAEIPFLNEITGIIANLLFSLVLSTNQMIANISFSNWSFQPNIFAMLVSLAIFIVVVLYCYKKMQQKSTQSMLNFI